MYKVLKVIITPIIAILFLLIFYLLITIYYLKFSYLYVIFILYLLNILTTWFIFFSRRRLEVKFSWIFTISVFPIIGMIVFVLYGRTYKYRKEKSKYKIYSNTTLKYEDRAMTNRYLEIIKKNTPNFYEVFKLTYKISSRSIHRDNKITILEPEEHWIALIKEISKAKKYILLTYFIVGRGKSLDLLCDLLIKKAREGVKIHFLYDHVGTYFQNFEKLARKLMIHGIEIKRFQKFIMPFVTNNTNYRNHRKDVIIDGRVGFTGGINIGDAYLNLGSRLGKIYDLHCKIVGNAVKTLELIFMNDWYFTTTREINYIVNNEYNVDGHKVDLKNLNFLQIVDSGPIKPFSIHKNIILKMINSSKKRIWLSTPYFIPPDDILDELKIAAKLGKDVRILIPGKTDKIFILSLSKLYASELLKFGIKVYTMTNVFNHAKVFVFDDDVSIISTTNIDNRSFFVDYQTMVISYNKKVNRNFSKKIEECFALSNLLKIEEIKKWNFIYKALIKTLKFASPIL